jgi:hypothetical protein
LSICTRLRGQWELVSPANQAFNEQMNIVPELWRRP